MVMEFVFSPSANPSFIPVSCDSKHHAKGDDMGQ